MDKEAGIPGAAEGPSRRRRSMEEPVKPVARILAAVWLLPKSRKDSRVPSGSEEAWDTQQVQPHCSHVCTMPRCQKTFPPVAWAIGGSI